MDRSVCFLLHVLLIGLRRGPSVSFCLRRFVRDFRFGKSEPPVSKPNVRAQARDVPGAKTRRSSHFHRPPRSFPPLTLLAIVSVLSCFQRDRSPLIIILRRDLLWPLRSLERLFQRHSRGRGLHSAAFESQDLVFVSASLGVRLPIRSQVDPRLSSFPLA